MIEIGNIQEKLEHFIDHAIDTGLVLHTTNNKCYSIHENKEQHLLLLNVANKKSKFIMIRKSELYRLLIERPKNISSNKDSSLFFFRQSPIQADSYIPSLYDVIAKWMDS